MTDDTWTLNKTLASEDEEKSELDYQIKIADLENSISIYEAEINDLKEKITTLQNENTKLKSSGKRIAFQLKGRSSTINTNISPTIQIAELIKDKKDLEELAERMINMLTDKEIENNQLRDEYDTLTQEDTQKIFELNNLIEELQEELEITRKANDTEIDYNAILMEYNEFKERTFDQLKESYLKEEQHKKEIDRLNDQILHRNAEIQSLEFENLHWIKTNKRNEEINFDEYKTNQSIISVIDQLREELSLVEKNKENIEKKYLFLLEQKESEIKEISEQNRSLSKRISELNKEYKDKIEKTSFNVNTLIKEVADLNEKIAENTKQKKELENKTIEYKILIDKKGKELKEINETAIIIKQSKEKTIIQLEKTISSINEANNSLIEQNKELINQLKMIQLEEKSDTVLSNMIMEQTNTNQNSLLDKENKHLKEVLAQQAKEIVLINSLREENTSLKTEIDSLKEEKDTVDKNLEQHKELIKKNSTRYNLDLSFRKNKMIGFKRQCSSIAESLMDKKLARLNELREKDKIYYTEKIDKLNQELCEQKVKLASQEFEKDNLIAKYRNILHLLTNECKKKGITLTFNI